MKKGWMLLGISVLSLTALTGCTSSADTMPSPSPSATMNATASPEATMPPAVSIAPAVTASPDMEATPAGINSVEDSKRVSEKVSDEVEKLSEIDEAEALVAGNIALVGVKYDDQYQGGLTDRLKDMVQERVDIVDKTVTTVHVTDDGEMMTRIAELREKLDDMNFTFEQLQTKLLELGSSITGGGMPEAAQPDVTQPQSTTGV
ncbi:MAG: YhcN/YlaJ family sporulation lipoprotein [Clostridia bacterium]|nr:YhcN/YlaJ family sporulation lipoprotein [Clostridia bacterium]